MCGAHALSCFPSPSFSRSASTTFDVLSAPFGDTDDIDLLVELVDDAIDNPSSLPTLRPRLRRIALRYLAMSENESLC
jgi:hypothetical protein